MAFLFVYGTLRKEASHPMSEWVSQNAHYMGKGKVQGLLFQISWYPAFVKSDNPLHIVHGDIFEINDDITNQFFKKLDEYEGDEYEKQIIEVEMENQKVNAFVYVFSKPVEEYKRIISGDFLLGS